jgi:hypothetical protein
VDEKTNMNVVKGFEQSVDFWRQLSHGRSSLTHPARLTSTSCVNNQSHNLVYCVYTYIARLSTWLHDLS